MAFNTQYLGFSIPTAKEIMQDIMSLPFFEVTQ
jgi:hypothetical protein